MLTSSALERDLFEPQAIRDILNAHFTGQRNYRFLIWSLMCLEWWHQLFIDPTHIVKPVAGATSP